MSKLSNKNILITGSTKGIGKEISLGISAKGANVILLGRNSEELEKLYDHISKEYKTSPMIIECDLENLDQNQANEINNEILKAYGNLDAVINNASLLGKMSALSDYELETWDRIIKVNLTASFLLSKSFHKVKLIN